MSTQHKSSKTISINTLIGYLNKKYGMEKNISKLKNIPYTKRINFKTIDDKTIKDKNTNIINISEYPGAIEFSKRFAETYSKQEELNAPMKDKSIEAINTTFDFVLHSILTFLHNYNVKGDDNYSILLNEIIPRLGLPRNEFMIEDYYALIDAFFTNQSKLATKVYNFVFPHGRHDGKKKSEVKDEKNIGVRNIFLQHIPRYHIEILEKLIKDEEDEETIYEFVYDKFIKEVFDNNSNFSNVPEEERTLLVKQLKNPDILNNFKNFTLKNLSRIGVKKNEDSKLSANEKLAIKELVKELNITSSFIKIVLAGKNFEEADNEKMEEYYNDYVEKLNNLNLYFTAQRQNRKKRLNTTDLITYYIQTTVFVGKILGYKYPMKQFNQEIGGNYHFDFNKDVRKKINTLINDNVSNDNAKGLNQDIETFISENKDFIKQFGKPSKQNVERVMNQFANIGSLLNIGDGVHKPSKTIRTAIGLGLVEWIVRQTELIAAADGKKVDVRIYIK